MMTVFSGVWPIPLSKSNIRNETEALLLACCLFRGLAVSEAGDVSEASANLSHGVFDLTAGSGSLQRG